MIIRSCSNRGLCLSSRVSDNLFRYRWYLLQMQVLTYITHLYLLMKASLFMHRVMRSTCYSIISPWPIKGLYSGWPMGVAAAQHEATKVVWGQQLWSTHAAYGSGVWVGAATYRSTNLLLSDVIELYPDLLLGRRMVMMRNEDGRWRNGRYWMWGYRVADATLKQW